MSDWFTEGPPHIWRPYAQMKTVTPALPVARTYDSRLVLADGRELIDGIASWWSACHGYNHPHIREAVTRQLEVMPHVMFGGLAHEPALTLAKRLCGIVPQGLSRVFFSDSGSTAVEIALKMALQYWRNQGNTSRNKFICFRDGYHGDTMGAMMISDPEKSMHKAFRSTLPKQFVLDVPQDEYGVQELAATLEGVHTSVAALIIEPLVQGAGGMRFHSADVLAEIHRLCKQHGILFIADEVATGFARTGYMFACDEAGIVPDIMCLGKALTGGTMGLAATLTTEAVFEAFLDNNPEKALMHGPTFMANPLACAAANASLDLFENEPRLAQVEKIEIHLSEALGVCRHFRHVLDARVKGAVGVVQLDESRMDAAWLRERFLKEGVWLRPLRDVVYLTPAFTIPAGDLTRLTDTVTSVLYEWSKL